LSINIPRHNIIDKNQTVSGSIVGEAIWFSVGTQCYHDSSLMLHQGTVPLIFHTLAMHLCTDNCRH